MELLALALLIHVVMYLWLTVAAFTRSVVWGILVLIFSPLSGLAFGVGYFRDVRLPFLLFLASLGFVIAAFFMMTPKDWQNICERTEGALCISGTSSTNKLAPKPPTNVPATSPTAAAVPSAPVALAPSVATPVVAPAPSAQANILPPTVAPTPAPSTLPTTKPTAKGTAPLANFPKKHSLAQEDPLQVKRAEPEPDTITISPGKIGKYINRYLIITLSNNVERAGLLKKVDEGTLTLERKWEGKGSTAFTVSRGRIKTIRVLKTPPKE